MSAIRPGGDLLQLPREIRDQIYSDYFNGAYPVFWSYHVSEDDKSQDKDYHLNKTQNDDSQAGLQQTHTDIGILQTSKVLHSDVKDFLLSKVAAKTGTYKYVIDLDTHNSFSNLTFKETTEHMTNVIFEVRVHSECAALRAKADSYESKTISDASFMNSICEATIERFAGSSVIRESFRITFKADYVLYKQSFSYFTKTRFFLALRGLTGFKQVTVVLKWSVISGSDYRYEVRKGVKHVQLGLLRDLGPADIKNAAYKVDEVGETSTYFFVELEFQPLKHHLRRLRVEAITCGDFECSCGIDEGGE